MYAAYLEVLADISRKVFESLTATRVIGVQVKRDRRLRDRFAVALMVPYKENGRGVSGKLVLGFSQETEALLLAGAIAEKMGEAAPAGFDGQAIDLLGDFMGRVVELTGARWRKLGLAVRFESPEPLMDVEMPTLEGLSTEAFVVVLNLSVGWVVFNISFSEDARRYLGRKILVLDDSLVIRGLLGKELSSLGCEVAQCARRGAEDVLAGFSPDLIVMDLAEPGEASMLEAEGLMARHSGPGYVLLAGAALLERFGERLKGSGAALLAKPVRMDRFMSEVKRLLSPTE